MRIAVDQSWLLALVLCAARILAWASVAPPIATAGVPRMIRPLVAVALALPVVPAARAHLPGTDVASIATALFLQLALGAGLGFLTRLVFAAVEAAGSLLDVVGGFSLSAAYDPLTTTTTSVFGRFYMLLCSTLIFATDAHLMIFRGFLRTFSTVPLDSGFSLSALASHVTTGVSDLFVSALQIAGPLIVVLFVADVALGVLNRIAPQLNAFSMSFPVKIALTLLLTGMTLALMPQTVTQLATDATRTVARVVG